MKIKEEILKVLEKVDEDNNYCKDKKLRRAIRAEAIDLTIQKTAQGIFDELVSFIEEEEWLKVLKERWGVSHKKEKPK